MYYLKLLRQYSLYTLFLLATIIGVFYQSNFGCADHAGSASGFEDVGPYDKVFYSYRPATAEAYRYGELVVYRPRETQPGETSAVRVGRVVGKPGDVVEIHSSTLYRNGEADAQAIPADDF